MVRAELAPRCLVANLHFSITSHSRGLGSQKLQVQLRPDTSSFLYDVLSVNFWDKVYANIMDALQHRCHMLGAPLGIDI